MILKILSRIKKWLGVIILIGVIVISQIYYLDTKKNGSRYQKISDHDLKTPIVIPLKTLKRLNFGTNNFLADIIWLQTIQYYGSGNANESHKELSSLIKTITTLDNRFLNVYSFGLVILPNEGFVEEAVALGQDGLANKNLSGSWEIPYYLGLIYHFNLKNHLQAARLFEEASKKPGAPEATKLTAANYYVMADQRQTAFALYKVVYETSKNQFIKDRAKLYLDHWGLIFALEDAAKIFKKKYNRWPNNLEELTQKRIVKKIPKDPLDKKLIIDSKTGLVSEEITVNSAP